MGENTCIHFNLVDKRLKCLLSKTANANMTLTYRVIWYRTTDTQVLHRKDCVLNITHFQYIFAFLSVANVHLSLVDLFLWLYGDIIYIQKVSRWSKHLQVHVLSKYSHFQLQNSEKIAWTVKYFDDKFIFLFHPCSADKRIYRSKDQSIHNLQTIFSRFVNLFLQSIKYSPIIM